MSISSFGGNTDRLVSANQRIYSRNPSGRIIFVEDFRSPSPGVWNDALGSATRDTDITFNGLPSLRLDPQGQTSGAASPGRTASTSGVVVKRRIHDGFTSKFGIEMWFRMTSKNLTSNTFFSLSIYNRDGTNAYHSRVWLNPNGNNTPMLAQILDGTATNTLSGTVPSGTAVYATVATSQLQNGAGTHVWDPATGSLDKAGGWHYIKLVTDMAAKKYVSLKIDGEATVDLSNYSMDVTPSAGFAGMHFSVEMFAATSTARSINIAQLIGTLE